MNLIVFIVANIIVLGLIHWVYTQKLERLYQIAIKHSRDVYRQGLEDGRFWDKSYMKKYYEASPVPIEHTQEKGIIE